MFSDINSESIRRLSEAKASLILVKSKETIHHLSIDIKIYKGIFFVLLYGALEYTITASVQRCIAILNSRNYDIQSLKSTIYSLAFHNECNAIADAKDKKWTKRYNLFSQITNNKVCIIEDHLFPTSIGNIKYQQLESIWKTFGISAEVLPDLKIKGRLSDLADNRNAIAHGRELASVVGGRYAVGELEAIYNDISAYCSYITAVFEEYINNEDCLI